MLAVTSRAYPAAQTLLSTIQCVATKLALEQGMHKSKSNTDFGGDEKRTNYDESHMDCKMEEPGDNGMTAMDLIFNPPTGSSTPVPGPSCSNRGAEDKNSNSSWFKLSRDLNAKPTPDNADSKLDGNSVKDAAKWSFMAEMIYPPGSHPDCNPLHVVCCNDTCSFTWTGDEHINQDIFECRSAAVCFRNSQNSELFSIFF